MTVLGLSAGRSAVGVLAWAAASISLGGCSPRTTAEAKGTVATPDTAGFVVSSVPVRTPLQLSAQLYVEHDAAGILVRRIGLSGGKLLIGVLQTREQHPVAHARSKLRRHRIHDTRRSSYDGRVVLDV